MGSSNSSKQGSYEPIPTEITAQADYILWVVQTKGTRSIPTVYVRVYTKHESKGHNLYHYKNGCDGSLNKVPLGDERAFNSRFAHNWFACNRCYNERPTPTAIDPPVFNSPEGVRLNIPRLWLITSTERIKAGPLALPLQENIERMKEMGRARRAQQALEAKSH